MTKGKVQKKEKRYDILSVGLFCDIFSVGLFCDILLVGLFCDILSVGFLLKLYDSWQKNM